MKRKAMNMTKAMLSRKTGISYSRICSYERDLESALHMEACRLVKIADALKWDIKEVIKPFCKVELLNEKE